VSRRRNLSIAAAAIIVAGGLVVTTASFYMRLSVQPRGGVQVLDGLESTVQVSYDEWAIPTIVGEDMEDVLRAQGFVHASERLWQLELFQRIARGRLAGIFGEAAIGTDRLVRTLDLWGAAGRALASLSPAERQLIEAYADGVNQRIETWRGPLPPEFLVLRIAPQPWSAQASLAVARIMSLDLSGWRTELSRIATLARVPSSLHPELEHAYPDWGPTIMQDDVTAGIELAGAESPPVRGLLVEDRPAIDGGTGGGIAGPGWDPITTLSSFAFSASNSWVIGSSRSIDGYPLLANDMHLSLRAPSTWFVNSLHAGARLAVAGVSIPGAPGVVVGLNRDLAWGFTNAMLDDGDFVVESLNLDGSMYRSGDEWRPFETRVESIDVRGGDPVEHVVRSTTRGPVITDVLDSGGLTLSLLWTGIQRRGAASAILSMNGAGSVGEFVDALGRFASPNQNVVFATTSGELGYGLAGSIPQRDGMDPTAPVSFERLPGGWPGFVPPDSMPRLLRPTSDYIASANNLQAHDLFGVVGSRYPLPFRARRIVDVLESASGWSVEEMVSLQLDTRSLWALRLRPRAIAAARRLGLDDVARELGAWDGDVSLGSTEAPVFFIWLFRLRQLVGADELDERGYFPQQAIDRVLEAGGSPWVDDVRTPGVETLEELEDIAMTTAVETSAGRTWGELHFENSSHPLGQVPLLQRLFRFDSGPYPSPGAPNTVRPDNYSRWSGLDSTAWTPPFVNEYGPSQRFVAHMDPAGPTGHFFLPTGQSGNPLDRHYRDMTPEWLDGRMVEVSLDPAERFAVETTRMRLQPPRDGGG
jgi:penicillin amidase